jgi:tRNA A-37 threonylcarbamoyl transferase component Bud32
MAQQTRVLNDRYEIGDPLGRGGMAQVFRGTDRLLGRPVAIKVLDRRYRDDAKFQTRFRREAQAAAGINHPNVVSIYDTGSQESSHYIVMEYIDGDTLGDILQREGALPSHRAVAIADSVAQALEAAHQKGMVHRDVKPGNIMVDRSGTVKVLDFGIARAAADDTLTQTGVVLGTAAYLSPEQAQGETVDARSDVYSLGCVLYEMLTGRQPFTADSPLGVAYKHVREEPIPPSQVDPDIPPEVEAVVMTALAKDPAARYPSGGAMREALSAAATGEMPAAVGAAAVTEPLAGGDTAVMPETVPPGVPPPGGRGGLPRWLPWLVIGVILVALVVLGFLAFGGDEPRQARQNGGRQTGAPEETTPSPNETADPVGEAFANLAAVLAEGVGSGEMTQKAADDIGKPAEDALAAYQEGDLEGAAEKLVEAHAKTQELLGQGEILSEERATLIHGAIDTLADAMGVSAAIPAEESRGEDGEGSGPPEDVPGEGKGKSKGKDEGDD